MTKVLVTGASGFVGRHALSLLIQDSWEVHALHSAADPVSVPGVIWHYCDLLDPARTRACVQSIGASHCLHFAWYAKPGAFWSSTENFRWVTATLNLVDEFRRAGGTRFAAAGTCAEYDWNFGYCREDVTPRAPSTTYGKCKDALQQVLTVYGESHQLSVVWGRIFHVYGPFEAEGRLVPSVLSSITRGEQARCTHGNQFRDFLHVQDVARAFVHLLCADTVGAFNIASGEPVTIRTLVEGIAAELGRRDLLAFGAIVSPPNDPPMLVADNRKLRAAGWTPSFSLASGIADTVAWWRSQVDRR